MLGKNKRPRTEEEKKHLSEKFTGLVWWNNGEIQIQSKVQPEGFVRGKLPHEIKFHWYNNGKECVMAEECPVGFVKGRKMNL